MSHTREWIRYRRAVRKVARRFCDQPHKRQNEWVDAPCGWCAACAARRLVNQGGI